MDILSCLRAYFQAVDPLHTVDVLPVTGPETPAVQFGLNKTEILACTQVSFQPAPPLAGLDYVVLTQHSPIALVQEGLDANARGFDPKAANATKGEAEAFRRDLVANCAFTAKLNGQPVAAGMFTPPVEGVAEVVGVTTLDAFRRRGIATALTGEIVRAAFNYGVMVAVLRTDNPQAYRIYTRIGFAPAAWLLTRPDARDDHA